MDIAIVFMWLLAAAAVTLAALLIPGARNLKNATKSFSPPEADGGWPVIGHMRLLSGPELPHIVLSAMADKYGPVFTIRLGVYRALIVSSWEAAKECFTTNDVVFSNRPRTAAIEHMCYNFAMFGFSQYGPYWREMRKISAVSLLSGLKVSTFRHLFETEIARMVRKLRGQQGCLEMKQILGDMTIGLMLRIIFNSNRNDEKIDGAKGEKLREGIRGFFRKMNEVTVTDVVPSLEWLDRFWGTNESFKKTGQGMDCLLQAWLDGQKRRGTIDNSFMAEMTAVADEVARQFPEYSADTITKATCQAMLLGGTDTMTTTLTWALSLLLNNRHTIRKAQQELDLHVSPKRLVKASDTESLVYILAIIKETLRLYPPAALLPPRESAEDCHVAGYRIPAGTRLIINAWKLHRDPRIWADPLQFRPERFLSGAHKEIDVRGQHFELLPFGGGRRICPGIAFSIQFMVLTLGGLLHAFDIETGSGEGVDMKGSLGAMNVKDAPLEVVLRPRLSPAVYD
ncbi:Cytochrome P450 82C4 [Striga hermonthica]|uniref:Flavonoid-6-hydroxylase n=1 Tax=Striga hermonthica TaxID=68872 RepID=A0A9N7N4T5_STRHE|nr:Cytochrome P450 82C4 [Striga hermonthica]